MGCCKSLMSCFGNTLYYTVNLIFMLVGIALLCGGIIVFVSYECTVQKLIYEFLAAIGMPTTQDLDISSGDMAYSMNNTAIILMSVGGALILLALFAFMGTALKGLEKIVVFIYIILALAFIGALCFTIYFAAVTDRPQDVDPVYWTLHSMMKNYKPTTGLVDDFTIEGVLMDMVQSNFHCCGLTSYKDYGANGIAKQVAANKWDMRLWNGTMSQDISVPPTCCRTFEEKAKWANDSLSNRETMGVKYFPTAYTINAPTCYTATPNAADVHTERSCVKAIYQEVDQYELEIILISSAAIVVFLMILAALFAKLCSSSDK